MDKEYFDYKIKCPHCLGYFKRKDNVFKHSRLKNTLMCDDCGTKMFEGMMELPTSRIKPSDNIRLIDERIGIDKVFKTCDLFSESAMYR